MKNTDKIFRQIKANPIATEPLGLGTIPDLPKTFTFPKFQIGDTVSMVDYGKIGGIIFLDYIRGSWVYTIKVVGSGDEIDHEEHSLIKGSKNDAIEVFKAFKHIHKYQRFDYVAYEDLTKQPKEKGDDAVIPKIYKVLSSKLLSIDLELIDVFDNGIVKNTGRKVQMSLPEKSLKVIGENAMKLILNTALWKRQFKNDFQRVLGSPEYLQGVSRNDKLRIGFTTQFYTLWEVDGNYRYFLRNLSMNKDMAIELAKDAGATDLHVYTDLKGMESIYYEDSVAKGLFDWQFPYGKLKGEDTRYSEDVWQLERIAKQGNQYAIDRLVELGNHTFHKSEIVTKTFAENDMAADQAKSQEATRIQQALKEGFIEFVVTKNITNYDLEEDGNSDFIESNDTTIVSEEYGTITLKRVPIKMMSYNGFDYFLPVINGKATKIKNKKIRITIIGLDVDDRLLGTDLKILK